MDLDLSALPWLPRDRATTRPRCSSTGGDLASPGDGGWPLPAAGGRRPAHSYAAVRPNLSSAVGSEDEEEKTRWNPLVFAPSVPNEEGEPADDDKWGRRPRNSTT